MELLLSVMALLIPFAGGAGAVLLLVPSRWRKSPSGLAGAALVVGAGIISLLSFCFGFMVQGRLLRWIVTATCVMLFALGRLRYVKQVCKSERPNLNASHFILGILVIGQLCFVTWLSLYKSGLGWDGLFNWEAKALIAFRYNGAIPLRFYTSGYEVTHVAYPVFFPLLQVWIYEWLGHVNQSMIKLLGPYFYLAALLLLISSAKRVTNSLWAAIIAVLLFGVVPAYMLGDGSVSSGYADFPLAVVWLCALVQSIEYCRTGALSAARLTGISAMFLPFVKNDGVIALLCVGLTVMPKVFQERNWKAAAWMMTPGFVVLFGWHILIKLSHVEEGDLLPFTPANLMAHLNRTGTLVHLTTQEALTWCHWGILWPATLVAGAFLVSRKRFVTWYPLVVNAILPLLLYPCIFFFSAWSPVEDHVRTALPRLLIHNAPAAILLVSIACGILLGFETDENVAMRTGEAKIPEICNNS